MDWLFHYIIIFIGIKMAPLQKFQQDFVTSISTSNGKRKNPVKKIGNK
jgi:hypothetical protein